MASKRSTTRKSAAVGLAIVGIAGLSLAAAAQLNATSSSLGATTTVVAPCQPNSDLITATYTTAYTSAAPAGYKVSSVVLSGLTGCVGKNVKVSLLDLSDNPVGGIELTAANATASTTLTVPAAATVPALNVVKLAVVISG
jgi:hypothetical protein